MNTEPETKQQYIVELICDSDEMKPVVELFVTLRRIAPFMVDNVDLRLGILDHGLPRWTNVPSEGEVGINEGE